ncbi:hypothetical protein [Bacillus thuringiensis]|uniref:hypothetical protein n=1 Tax=Bacillus thuringiensis TaxID=1428 RepID=UPI0015966762|nr:hypothetical protein [Bacillus thuringiensis]
MVPFQDGQCATTSGMLYFYYDVFLQVRQETPSIFIRNHPTKKEGYLLEHTRSIPDYFHKFWYHQTEIADLF